MKRLLLIMTLPVLLGGCAPKKELDAARGELAEAQSRIETLQRERVRRSDFEAAQASLRTAGDRIAALERELQEAREQVATQQKAQAAAGQPVDPGANDPAQSATAGAGLAKGTYVLSNGTFVYSPDALLNFGNNVQISSPSGLLVSDTEQKIVGGDLAIKAKSVLLETSDGVLTSEPDGSVKFTGSTLTMKFEDKPAASQKPQAQIPPADSAATAEQGTRSP